MARASAASAQMTVTPYFNGAPVLIDAIRNTNAAGQLLSVTRADLLISNVTLKRDDGEWFTPSDSTAFIRGRDGRFSLDLGEIPDGNYNRVRFSIGISPKENHSDPAARSPGDPLNPNVNGLHWGWQGGYIFLALEGHWIDSSGAQRGYSFHLGGDRMLTTVEISVDFQTPKDRTLGIALELDRVFSAQHVISITPESSSTHSRTNDLFANVLRDNLKESFKAARSGPDAPAPAKTQVTQVELATNATPYRLVISKLVPRPSLPSDNPLTGQGVELGRRLFFDQRLSINNSQSCASCHQPGAGFSDPGKRVSEGAEGAKGKRNAMPLYNLAWKSSYFWDGRAASLREQVLMPIENPVEMHESMTNVAAKLASAQNRTGNSNDVDYPGLFLAAFGSKEITPSRIAKALEQYLLAQVAHTSKFDRAMNGEAEFTDEEKHGFQLFSTEYDPVHGQYGADCFHCHGGPLFQSQTFANNGLDTTFSDIGRKAVTGRDGDAGKFAVPSLRNVAVTGPYMHDGRFSTLEEVIEHYSTGIKRSSTLDPNLAKHPDGGVPLSSSDKKALVAFLRTLTDENLTPASARMPDSSWQLSEAILPELGK